MSQDLNRMLERFHKIAEGKTVSQPEARFRSYAITATRGGVGKTTLSFNLGWHLSRANRTILVDVCPQRNFTHILLGDTDLSNGPTIYEAIVGRFMPTDEVNLHDLVTSVSPHCPPFKGGSGTFVVPGSENLFLFPSLLYATIGNTTSMPAPTKRATIKRILESLSNLVMDLRNEFGAGKVLIDCSPFFGGATHLAWVAAEALIIPVRVDQPSVDALRLTLSLLREETSDLLRMNKEAGINHVPKVHAIAVTHCGWSRQFKYRPDRSTQACLSQIAAIAQENRQLFSSEDPIECIHVLDDFHASGRISGSERIPLAKLEVGKFHTVAGQRLQVNGAVVRYNREMEALAQTL